MRVGLFFTDVHLVAPALQLGVVFSFRTVVPALVNSLGEDVVDIFSRNLLLGMLIVGHFISRKLLIDA